MTAVEKFEAHLIEYGFDLSLHKFEIQTFKEMEKEQKITLGKRCFYKGFEKAKSDDANCFTAWREEAEELLTKQQEK